MSIFYIVLSLILLSNSLEAKDEAAINSQLVEMLQGPNNLGKDFWITVPPPYLVADPSNFTRIFVASKYDANVRVSQINGIDRSLQLIAGEVKSFDLKPGECQPYVHNLSDNYGLPAQVHEKKALNITSDFPIVVYVMIRYQYTTDGFLAIPESVLGKEYIATNYDAREWSTGSLPNFLTIVAPNDNTIVEFNLGGNDLTQVKLKDGKILKPGDKTTFYMNKGDVVVISNIEQDETLSGSLISADKDVAVISANYCADVPLRVRACDYIVEMETPISSWGNVYAIPNFEYRDKPSILRVFAKDPETTVYRDGQELFYFTNGVGLNGGKQNNAWYETRVWPVGLEKKPAIYSSDKPIYIMLYNPSSQDDGQETDPFQMLISPVEQYQKEVLFYSPSAAGGSNFQFNIANVIFEVDEKGFVPEDMMFGTVEKSGEVTWESFRKVYNAEVDLFTEIGSGMDKVVLNKNMLKGSIFGHKQIELPGEGTYIIKSTGLVNVFSSGFNNYDSYGFPAGTSVKILNSGDSLAPKVEWTIGCDGKVIGETSEMFENNTNIGLFEPYSFPDDAINFSQLILDEEFVKGSKSINWTANVLNIEEPASLVVTFYDLAGNFTKDTIKFDPKDNSLDDPIVNIKGDLLLCNEQESVSLVLEDGNYTEVEWSNGETSKTLTTNIAGDYYATIYDDNGCTKTSEIFNVKVANNNLIKILKIGNSIRNCIGDTVKLKIPDTYLGGEITWSNGESTREVSIIESGDYWFTYNNEDDDCDYFSNTYTVEFNEVPEKPIIRLENYLLKVETSENQMEWYYEGQNFNKTNLKIIAPTKNGKYTCEVFNSAGCSTMSDEFEVAFVSVEKMTGNELSITPNPNNGNFNLEINSKYSGKAKLTIFDLKGQEVFSKELNLSKNKFEENITLNNAAKGVYLLNIKTESGEVSSKFVIK